MKVLELSKEELQALPSEDRCLLLLLGHIANELSVLSKLFYWSSLFVQRDGVTGRAGIMQAQTVGRLFAGKLLEAWKAIRKGYFDTQLSRRYVSLVGNTGNEALDACRRYFGSTNSIFQTRNNFGFHYSRDAMHAGFDRVRADERLSLYFAESRGNCLYYASEVVVGTANGSMVGTGDVGAGVETLLQDLPRIAGHLQTFIGECIRAIVVAYFGPAEGRIHTEVVSGVATLDAVRLPYFVAPEHPADDT